MTDSAPDFRSTSLTLYDAWQKSFQELRAKVPVELYARVFEAWSSPHRKYHTRRHLQDGLNLMALWSDGRRWPATVALAYFFHDVVYDVLRKDNEERSARMAEEALGHAKIAPGVIEEISALIMATCHNAAPATDNERLLVDVDLSILGAREARYVEYTQQVREEYAAVPDKVFYPGRLAVMRAFVGEDGQKPIFHTIQGIEAFEERAHANISHEIERLAASMT